MNLFDRQASEIPYDDSEPEPVLRQDPEHPNRWSYSSPAVPTVRVQIERGQRGGYGWTLTAEGTSAHEVLELLREVDITLRARYGQPTNASLRGEYGRE